MNDYPRTFGKLPRLLAHPRQSRGSILRYQSRALRRSMRDAYENVFYYRQLFDREGIKPDDIRTPADLSRIPVTTKNDLRNRALTDILRKGAKREQLRTSRTSGSTGEPFSVWRSDGEEFLLDVFRRRAMKDFGLKMRDVMTRVMSRPVDPTLPWRIARMFGIFRQRFISLLKDPNVIAGEIRYLHPDVLTGNTGVLAQTARVVAASRASDLNLRFVVVGSEIGTPAMKDQIAKAFHAPVYDVYAANEFGLIAWECRTTGLYHVNDDSLILEVLDNEGVPIQKGEEGEAVLTALHLRNMPFIRFKLGDRVKKGPAPCPCGAPYSTIDSIVGRMSDYFVLPSGRKLWARAIDLIIREQAPWIAQFEVVQETVQSVVLRAIPLSRGGYTTESLMAKISAVLGEDIEFNIEIVDAIAPSPRGKFAFLRSKVSSEYDPGPDVPQA